MAEDLPSFDRPPLIETVLGMQFKPVAGMTTAHLGLFWRSLGDEWSRAVEAEPVGQMPVGDSALQAEAILRSSLGRRLRLMNDAGSRMVQIENGWLVFNWRRREWNDPYPSFDKLFPEFQKVLDAWHAFLAAEGFPEVRPTLWEITYVNLVVRGTVWNTPEDLSAVLPALLGTAGGSQLGPLTAIEGSWQFPIRESQGNLVVSVGLVPDDEGHENLRLTQIARGPASDRASLEQGLEDGHRAIVHTFADFTSGSAQAYWKRKQP